VPSSKEHVVRGKKGGDPVLTIDGSGWVDRRREGMARSNEQKDKEVGEKTLS